jgi:nucleoside-diphosphate-sugar epimerase
MAGDTVLVTGGSGYIGSWCVIELLQRGYNVRTTVRNLAKAPEARAAIAKVVDTSNLTFHAANLSADAGWEEAVAGCAYVVHVASPVAAAEPKDPNEMIVPAREGVARVIGAAIRAGVRQVAMTSSVAALGGGFDAVDGVFDETSWTDGDDPKVSAYARSKTLAERDAWALIEQGGGATKLATVLPALVIGPVLGKDYSDSVQVIDRLLGGKVPGVPRLGFDLVDVRDVADLHIRAMIDEKAIGQRFVAAGEWAWMIDIAHVLKAKLGAEAAKVPTRKAPDFLLRLMALVDKDIAGVVGGLGRRREFSSKKARDLLGWRPRPSEESIIDTARSLIAAGVV